MTNPTAEFFERLGTSGHQPLVRRANGTLRFELTDGTRTERWLVTIAKGDVKVSRAQSRADCVVRADRRLFDQLTTGAANAMAALLRGEMQSAGAPELLVFFQRLLPLPPTAS